VTLVAGRHSTVSVGSQRLRVSVENRGRGHPLLLINGIGATGDLFDPFRQHLDDRETIAFDAPGAGDSPAPLLPVTMSWLADVVSRLTHQMGRDRVDVLGLSWGGALAMELAHRHPHLVRRLVLSATMPGWGGVFGRPSALTVLASPARYYSPAYLRRIAPTLYGADIADRPDLLDSHVDVRSRHAPSRRGYLYQLMAIQMWSALPFLPRLRTPTLVLAGDRDPIIPLPNGSIITSLTPHGRLHVVEGGGHLFLFIRAEEMADVVRSFLDEDDATYGH
jgi:poly(3-hydroxyalkanoate) depolymerase